MPAFQYKATNPQGKTVKGVFEGDSEKYIRQKLRDQGLIPLSVTLIKEGKSSSGRLSQMNLGIRTQDIALFTRQFATLLQAGIPIEEALQGVAEQTEKKKFKNIILAVRAEIQEGKSLANAMASFPGIFSALFRASIHAGEQTGYLDRILNRLADYLERQQVLKQKVQQALVYPSLMICVSILIVSFLLVYVVPKILAVFQDNHQPLPAITLFLLGLSHFLGKYGIFLLLGLAALLYSSQQLLKKEKLRFRWHNFLTTLPIVGYLIKTVNVARFARTLGMLVNSGVPIIDSLKIALAVVGMLPIRKSIEKATEQIAQGRAIAQTFKETRYFSAMTLHLIANGEMSGQLESMLEKAADIQENEVSRIIDTGLTLLEPLIIIIMGAIVLFIVLAILLPIFQLDQLTG